MKKIFRNCIGAESAGVLFQAVINFQGLVLNSNDTSGLGTNLSGILKSTNLASLFNSIFTLALSLGAILAVLRIAYAGWLYMGAQDMWGSKQKAKEVIGEAILGLLLLIGIYIILFQINPCILNLNVLQEIPGQSGAAQCGGTVPSEAATL